MKGSYKPTEFGGYGHWRGQLPLFGWERIEGKVVYSKPDFQVLQFHGVVTKEELNVTYHTIWWHGAEV